MVIPKIQGKSFHSTGALRANAVGVKKLVSDFNLSKASGPDTISSSVWNEYENGSVHKATKNRPISLTCETYKLFEHIICSHVRKHLDEQDVLTSVQLGFRRHHSCESH